MSDDRQRPDAEARRTVLVALAANAAIMVVKAIGGVMSGSSALLAEAAHSVADTANEGFLLTSLSRSSREADDAHPFGYGQERFLWAFVAAIGIFVAGAGFSLYQGLEAIFVGQEESQFWIAYVILGFAIVAEGISLLRAVRQTRGEAAAGGVPWRHHLRRSRDPTTKTVVFEDSAAVTGNTVAIAGIALHQATGEAAWEGVAALIVAALLVVAAFELARGASSLLVGQAATPEERREILDVLDARPEIHEVLQLLTMALAPDRLLVAARVDLAGGMDSEHVEEFSSDVDHAIRAQVPAVAEVFLDATDRDRFARASGRPLGVVPPGAGAT
ncbi:MAG TPA: cation diffusion facilitator family transporter [Baekduia sp.]|nr:cation diffusion facilitator family transporter [Baekduia sp.]